ncbi:MAG: aspartyl-tRNA(Asn)/glutamyl-tRNA(Gln) amidotransferase subunit B [Planctomycetota bacterium]|jgi:aspartyl-tRNA(Asn)/glutamyl-tRNA(Gln) amidotransferase subunit B
MSTQKIAGFTREGSDWISEATGTRWIPVIGLEVHAQLRTRTKLFCSCESRFAAPPNSLTCPVCTGQPGTLPVLNADALELAVRAALAVGAEINPLSKFDRKNYFYCDVPKNYQITQYDEPYCRGGSIRLASGRTVRLNRIHIEEDAGKSIHNQGTATLVDLNRAGVPLIESVTEADLDNSADAAAYLTALREILVYCGVSNADMEKGEMRCDVNISVHPAGEEWRTKVEIKNLNSVSNVIGSIEHEIPRQIAAWETGDPAQAPVQETRLFDVDKNATRSMRKKEGEADYRYFPDPDLPPLSAPEAFIEEQRSLLPELPAARRELYQERMGLSAYDADVLTASRDVSDFFEAVVKLCNEPKEAANWISNEILRALSGDEFEAQQIDELPLKPFDLSELIGLSTKGVVNSSAARQVMREMMKTGKAAGQLVMELGLEQVQDDGQLEVWCQEALVGRESVIEDVRAGNHKAVGALMGAVMKASGGKANPQKTREILIRLIG